MATVTGLCLRLKLMQNLRDLVRLRPSLRLDTCMWTQPRPQLSGNQDGDNVDGILGQPASFCLCPSPTTPATCIQLLLPRPSSTWLLVSCYILRKFKMKEVQRSSKTFLYSKLCNNSWIISAL
uniref:Uncharacterized protein n=1 Tax=Aegilops tauschii subsp. strangulata TaxID=200361 RepID=A0A453DI82_AEGTS